MITRLLVLLVAAGLAITPAEAQRLPVDDSIAAFVGGDSRLLWRAVTLADGVGLESGVSVPLRSLARGLQLELRGWIALESSAFGFDAAELELDLEHRLGNPERSFATSTTLRFGIISRAARIGPDIGWVGLRESILFF